MIRRPDLDDVKPPGHVVALLGCVVVVMIGFGVALTVLPVSTERIHGLAGANRKLVIFHVGVLTSVYAFGQLLAGPAVGRLGDRVGRRPLILAGMARGRCDARCSGVHHVAARRPDERAA